MPSSALPIAPASSVETWCALLKVIGLPCWTHTSDRAKAIGRNMYATTRHMSTKKLPTVASPRTARMMAVSAQKPIDAERKKFAIPKKIWLKFEKCWSPE